MGRSGYQNKVFCVVGLNVLKYDQSWLTWVGAISPLMLNHQVFKCMSSLAHWHVQTLACFGVLFMQMLTYRLWLWLIRLNLAEWNFSMMVSTRHAVLSFSRDCTVITHLTPAKSWYPYCWNLEPLKFIVGHIICLAMMMHLKSKCTCGESIQTLHDGYGHWLTIICMILDSTLHDACPTSVQLIWNFSDLVCNDNTRIW